jgi:Tfp pilus assembly pilus retraction ATPase PilT
VFEYLIVTVTVSLVALAVAALFARQVLSADTGTPKMQEVAGAIRDNGRGILVGEIRDFETADIAIHAALTGHLVFLHYILMMPAAQSPG